MEIISVVQNKGGSFKTSLTFELAYGLWKAGKKVLLIDMDSQGSLGILVDADRSKGIYDVMMKGADPKDLVQSFAYGDILPGNDDLSVIDYQMGQKMDDLSDSYLLLYDSLQKFLDESDYDYVLIDSGPSLGFTTMNAIAASDTVIVPVVPDKYSLHGVDNLYSTIELIKKDYNPDLEVDGIVITRWDRTAFARSMREGIESLAKEFDIPIYETPIRMNVAVPTAHANSRSIREFRLLSNGARDYGAVVKEFLAKRGIKQ